MLPRLLRLRPVRRSSTDLDLDLDFDLERDRDSSLASFLALCFSYSPVTAAPATPAAAIGTPSRIRLWLRLRLPSRFRDLLRWRCASPATAALARPTCATRLLRCLGSMCLLLLRDLPPSDSSITVTDLDLPLLECPLLDRDFLERDLCRCSSMTVVVPFSLFLRPAAYARAPTPAIAASAPISLTLDLLRPRPWLWCRRLRPRSDDDERERDLLFNLSRATALTAPSVPYPRAFPILPPGASPFLFR